MLPYDQSLVTVAFLWEKLPWPQLYKDMTRKTFFEGWSCFKFNNLGLALGTNKDVRELSWMLESSQSYALLIYIEYSFHFGFLWYSSFVINFPHFSKWYFRPVKILQLRHSQNNYQIWLYKLNLMWQELSYQIINISAVNQAVFCYY